jgi:PHS family inorganic phosphate transporter-like MFS transporter
VPKPQNIKFRCYDWEYQAISCFWEFGEFYWELELFPSDNNSLDEIWRISLVVGALPCLASLYHRFLLFKSQMIKDERARNDSQMMVESEKFKLILKNWKKLVYTAGSCFIFDVVFYANGIFQSPFINSIGFGKSPK